jgi:YD repeat-containing protein
MYRRELYKDNNQLLSIARELPAPGVMYSTVTITEDNIASNGTALPVNGSTTYQYEVFKPEMVGIQYNTGQGLTFLTTGNENPGDPDNAHWRYSTSGTTIKVISTGWRDLSIKDYTSRIGNLKRMIKYDNLGNKLSEKINHYLYDDIDNTSFDNQVLSYEEKLADPIYNYLGVIKERYGSVRATANLRYIDNVTPLYSQFDEALTMSNKETFPSFSTGSTQIDYKNGTKVETKNLGYDYYTGRVIKTLTIDAFGNRFITEETPAYMAGTTPGNMSTATYPRLGLKTDDEGAFMSNMRKHMLTQSGSTYTYAVDANNTRTGVVSATASTWSNAVPVLDDNHDLTTTGQGNIWRMRSTYAWMPLGTATNNLAPYSSFVNYYSSPGNTNWKKTSEITQYNVFSAALEASDFNSNYLATKIGYNSSKITISGGPARYGEIAYASAEDPILMGSGHLSGHVKKGGGTVVTDSTKAHTGLNSLQVGTSQEGFVYEVPYNKINKQNFNASVWVYSPTGDISGAQINCAVTAGSTFGTTGTTTKMAKGWYLLELSIPAAQVTGDLKIYCYNMASTPVYFDDFRFQPTAAVTTAYVYDNLTGELTHILDNNNLFTRYQYDAIGRLVRVYKEVLGKTTVPVVKALNYRYAKGS